LIPALMKLLLPVMLIFLCAAACGRRENIDELVQRGGFEAAYHYYSGDTPDGRYTGITIVINKNGGAVRREERSVSNSSRGVDKTVTFPVTGGDLKDLHAMLVAGGLFGLKAGSAGSDDARTIFLRIRRGSDLFEREESPQSALRTNEERQRFLKIIRELNDFVRRRLPPGGGSLLEY
jgi:hypothetical protein